MEDDFKKKIKILILLLGGLLLVFLVLFLLNFNKQPVENSEMPINGNVEPISNSTQNENTGLASTNNISSKTIAPVPKKISKVDVEKMASSFAERFGTYSNQANFSNVTDLKIFMSKKMQIWADDYITKQTKKDNDIYFGITTKSVMVETRDYNDETGNASVLVKTRRREATITTGNISNVYNQDITINLVKEDGSWKVDSVFWEKE